MIAFALYNLKGGVGKTSSAVNLAFLAAREGHRTLLWDLDPQGAASYFFNINNGLNGKVKKIWDKEAAFSKVICATAHPNLSIIPADLNNRKIEPLLHDLEQSKKRVQLLLKSIRKEFDFVFIDCPPTMTIIAENIFRAANFILLPLIPTPLSERTFEQVKSFFIKKDYDTRKIFPFFTMVDSRKRIHQDTIQKMQKESPRMLKTTIPNATIVEQMGVRQMPLHAFEPSCNVAMAYRNLWQEMKMLGKLKSRKLIQE